MKGRDRQLSQFVQCQISNSQSGRMLISTILSRTRCGKQIVQNLNSIIYKNFLPLDDSDLRVDRLPGSKKIN